MGAFGVAFLETEEFEACVATKKHGALAIVLSGSIASNKEIYVRSRTRLMKLSIIRRTHIHTKLPSLDTGRQEGSPELTARLRSQKS